MTPPDAEDPRQSLAETLLRKAHEQSRQSPERAPFWREGGWRCEYYKQDGPPRLKVFQGDVCVHEEVVQGRVDDRSKELKQTFASPPSSKDQRGRD